MVADSKRSRPRVQMILWNAAEGRERAALLRAAGYDVSLELPAGPRALRKLGDMQPSAVVIDLARRPASGRDVALAIRSYKALRQVPLVFVEGDPEKVAGIRRLLPDAHYTRWGRIHSALQRAVSRRTAAPVVPRSVFAGYSGVRLPQKLGIKPGSVVALVGAPRGFEKTLGDLPEGVLVRRHGRGRADLTLWFTKSRKELEERMQRMKIHAQQGALWIVWPKKTSSVTSDLSQAFVRQAGLAAGLVDYKVCAVDETWAGLKFARRRVK